MKGRSALELIGMRKSFGPTKVVKDVSLDLLAGEIHGLIGENGAGKTTLIKLLGGVHRPDSGTIEVSGVPVDLHGPVDARRCGITVVHQELAVFPDLGPAENVFIERLPTTSIGVVDRRRMERAAQGALAELGVRLDAKRPMRTLSIGHQQLVEIAKGLSSGSRVIVMDEPTAALTPSEVGDLFATLRRLAARGAAILFVSHRLDELFVICDRLTIMRDGERVHQARTSELTADDVIRHMVGRRLDGLYPKPTRKPGALVLSARGLTRVGVFSGVSLDLRSGEIVGLAGLVGAGRTEIARALFGIDRLDAGSVMIDGHARSSGRVGDAMRLGIGYLPEDRHAQGILLEASITRNVTLAAIKRIAGLLGLARRRSAGRDALHLSL